MRKILLYLIAILSALILFLLAISHLHSASLEQKPTASTTPTELTFTLSPTTEPTIKPSPLVTLEPTPTPTTEVTQTQNQQQNSSGSSTPTPAPSPSTSATTEAHIHAWQPVYIYITESEAYSEESVTYQNVVECTTIPTYTQEPIYTEMPVYTEEPTYTTSPIYTYTYYQIIDGNYISVDEDTYASLPEEERYKQEKINSYETIQSGSEQIQIGTQQQLLTYQDVQNGESESCEVVATTPISETIEHDAVVSEVIDHYECSCGAIKEN